MIKIGLFGFLDEIFGNKQENQQYLLNTFSKDFRGDARYHFFTTKVAINFIAKVISRINFLTFENGKQTKLKNYYMLNIEANKNQSATFFWQELITRLLFEGEALVIIVKDQLFLADSFEKVEKGTEENIYSNIYIKDQLLNTRYKESEILYFKDNITSISTELFSINNQLSKLISSSKKGYSRSKARKGKLKIPTNLAKTREQNEKLKETIEKMMEEFMDPDKDSVFIESNGMEYTEIDEAKGSKSNDSGRETKNFINDIFDFVAIAFSIPPSLLKGDTVDTKDAVNNFLSFCINPLAQLIENEINRKMYGYEHYSNNTYCKCDTTTIKSVDLRDIANSIDLLVRNGAFTINDTLRSLGKEEINSEIGDLRVMTKNNESIENFLKGGE